MNIKTKTHIVILAAGQGTRMASDMPKVMHKVANLPMLGHVLIAAKSFADDSSISIVIAPAMNDVADFTKSICSKIKVVIQDEQLGTAHAVSCALKKVKPNENDKVIVLFGDTPLIQAVTIDKVRASLDTCEDTGITVVGMRPTDSKAYGRLVCDDTGKLLRIVEYKHANSSEKRIKFCNSGIMGFKAKCLIQAIPSIRKQSLTGEYYLTDAIEQASASGYDIQTIDVNPNEVEGVNTKAELALVEARYQDARRKQALASGCTLLAPHTVYFSFDTNIEPDVLVEPNVFFGANVTVESQAEIRAFSYIEGAVIKSGAIVGPFARIRPNTIIAENARVGNFVEIKNSILKQNAKAGHLSYIGDTVIGASANIGAGTVTCNYDGVLKHKTTIEDGAFIGSNTSLIAPVTVGKNSIVAAGSVISKDVAEHELAVTRAQQKSFAGKAKEIIEKKNKQKQQEVA